jgi:uncharacterized membrane protein
MDKQMDYVLNHIPETIGVFIRSFSNEFGIMSESYIGRMGYWDTKLPLGFVIFSYGMIFFTIFTRRSKSEEFNTRQRTVFMVTGLLIIAFVTLSQYLTWNPVGSNRVFPFQGRYFIPVFPLFFLGLSKNLFHVKARLRQLILSAFLIFSGIFTIVLLINRFYYTYETRTVLDISCDSENLTKDGKSFIVNGSESVLLKNGLNRTDKDAFEGNHSILLTPDRPFGYTHTIENVEKDDVIRISVRRKGHGGLLIFQEDVQNGLYVKTARITSTKDSDWKNIEAVFCSPKDFEGKGLKVYLWYTGNDEVYFDSYRLSHMKRK